MMLRLRSHAAWHTLPQEVLASVYKSLDFDSKVRVESVCKAWGQATQQPHAGVLADAVMLDWSLSAKFFTIEANKQSRALPYVYGVIGWLAKRIRGVSSLHLRNDLDCTASRDRPTVESVLRQILPDVSAASLPEVTFEIQGPSYQGSHTHQVLHKLCTSLKSSNLQSQGVQVISHFSQLTSLHMSGGPNSSMSADCLSNLTSLQELTALDFPDFHTQLCSIMSLTKICIAPRYTSAIDLSAYTQLQMLCIGPFPTGPWLPISVFLPSGPDVSLQTLHAAGRCCLHDVAAATALTHLEMQTSQFKWTQWPTNLVKLRFLQIRFPETVLIPYFQHMPPEWQHYTSLQHLSLDRYRPWDTRQTPEWFTSLKQLTRLEIAEAAAFNFTACWTFVSQLQHLDLRRYEASSLQEDVLVLAEAPHLTYLSFADVVLVHTRDVHVLVLERLAAAIKESHAQHFKLLRLRASKYKWRANPLINVSQC